MFVGCIRGAQRFGIVASSTGVDSECVAQMGAQRCSKVSIDWETFSTGFDSERSAL
jgi:hypothetical protein